MWKILLVLLLFVPMTYAQEFCVADFNCDGHVDISDYNLFMEDYGRNAYNNMCTVVNPCNGNFDCDGDVDGLDMAQMQIYFVQALGQECPMCVHTECE